MSLHADPDSTSPGRDTSLGGLGLLAGSAEAYVMFTTDLSGTILEWNAGAARIHGYEKAEIVGRECDVLFVAEDRAAGVPELERALALRSGHADDERWHLRKDGSRFWGAGQMIRIDDSVGEPLGFGKVMRDFTRRREVEAAHIEAQRMEGVGVLAGGLAHLFNNLLTANLGNLELLLARSARWRDPDAAGLIEDALDSARRMAELTRQVVTFAGKERAHLQPVELRRLAVDALASLGTAVPADLRVTIGIPPREIVEGDPVLLRQLLTALFLNAVEAMAGQRGGELAVTAAPLELEDSVAPEFRGFDLIPGPYISLSVRDTGPGLGAGEKARVFDPFFSTKFPGRGLGLATAVGIVRMHAGAIAVQSAPGSGAVFDVLLPCRPSAQASRGAAERPAGLELPAASLALVVDREEIFRSLIARFLEAEGLTTVQAENALQAIRMLDRVGDRIVVTVVDPALPDEAGMRAELSARLRGRPVVALGSSGGMDIVPAARLQKPLTFDQLAGAVRVAVGTIPAP